MYLKHVLLRYLKRFGTVGKRWRVDTIFWLAEKTLKAMKLNGAFWLMVDDF